MNRLRRDDDADGRRHGETAPAVLRRRVPPRPGRKRPRVVMIADDTVDGREMYSEYLRQRGYVVVTAADGAAAIQVAHRHRPDVIVMDLAMPGLNGITATHRLKDHPRTRRIPVIVLTGYAFRAIQQGALEAGADVFLTKPCLPEDLERYVRDLLDRHRRG